MTEPDPYLHVEDHIRAVLAAAVEAVRRPLLEQIAKLTESERKVTATVHVYLESDEVGISHAANTAHARDQRDVYRARVVELERQLAELEARTAIVDITTLDSPDRQELCNRCGQIRVTPIGDQL